MATLGDLLNSDKVIAVYPELMKLLGCNEAVFISQVHFWTEINMRNGKNYYDGRYWTYNTYEDWQKEFPWLSIGGIRHIIKRLEDKGVLLTGCYNKAKFDRTKWYAVNYEKLEEISGKRLIWGEQYPPDIPYKPIGEFVPYEEYIKSDTWEIKRRKRIEKDRFRCAKCGSFDNLSVHHKTYKNLGHENLDDLITLCWNCHKKEHPNKRSE